MKRTKSKMKTFFLGSVFGAIILAIISSAIWDKVGAPIFDNIFKFLLNISTLGLEKYRNTIYEEISKGFHENVSLEIYMLVTSIILGIIITTIMVLLRIRKIQKDKTKTFKDIFKYPKFIRSTAFLLFYLVFSITSITLAFVKIIYINKSVTYYNQLLDIVSPDVTDNEYKTFKSKFAQIKSRNDYIKITNELKKTCDQKGNKLPVSPRFIF